MKFLTTLLMLVGLTNTASAYCGDEGVFVFGAYWCPACRSAEQFLMTYAVNYKKFEVTNNSNVQQFMREHFATTAIPIIVVDGDYRVGFDAAWLRQALCVN